MGERRDRQNGDQDLRTEHVLQHVRRPVESLCAYDLETGTREKRGLPGRRRRLRGRRNIELRTLRLIQQAKRAKLVDESLGGVGSHFPRGRCRQAVREFFVCRVVAVEVLGPPVQKLRDLKEPIALADKPLRLGKSGSVRPSAQFDVLRQTRVFTVGAGRRGWSCGSERPGHFRSAGRSSGGEVAFPTAAPRSYVYWSQAATAATAATLTQTSLSSMVIGTCTETLSMATPTPTSPPPPIATAII